MGTWVVINPGRYKAALGVAYGAGLRVFKVDDIDSTHMLIRIEQGIVSQRFDAGIRMGERVARDMIAIRIGPEIRMAAVATPAYFKQHPKPRRPEDLAAHCCINMRFATLGNVYTWEFEKGGREVNVKVEGQLTVNDIAVIRQATLSGVGLGFIPEDMVAGQIERGELIRVLDDWTPPFPGYYLYYPSRRQQSPAFTLLVDALRHRAD